MDSNPLSHEALFGGVSGASLAVGRFEVCPGLALRQTYAHVMSPYILAFNRPESPDRHHPGPWKSAQGGTSFEIQIEVVLDEGVQPTGFDRLNTLWWTVALLRLHTGAVLRMPIVSDTSFNAVASGPSEPMFWATETAHRQLRVDSAPPEVVNMDDLTWLRRAFVEGSALMSDESFGRSFKTYDGALWAHSNGSAIITVWAALETLIGPGQYDISKKLASSIAALLEPLGPDRDRIFQQIKKLYESRGRSAHASRSPDQSHLFATFDVARRAFITCINNREVPDFPRLQLMWKRGTTFTGAEEL